MRARTLPVLLALAMASIGETAAVQRVHRLLDERDGVPPLPIFGMGQDRAGYLWLATQAGVVRYDGVGSRNLSEHPPRDRPWSILTGRDGEVLVLDQAGVLSSVAGLSMEPVTGPGGPALDEVESAAFGPDGALWASRSGSLFVRREGAWSEVPTPPGMRIHHVAPLESGRVLVATDSGVHRLSPDGSAVLLEPTRLVIEVLPLDEDGYAILHWQDAAARLVEVSGGARRVLGDVPGRPIDVVLRGTTFWLSTDRYLAALRPGRPPEIMGPKQGFHSGGPLLVDREGSLWVGTAIGLMRFPEPDTILLNDHDGLPSSHTRLLNLTEEGIWLTTWQGSALITEGPEGIEVAEHPTRHIGRGCVDARGALWSSRTDWFTEDFAILERADSVDVEHRMAGYKWIDCCAAAFDVGLWMFSNLGVLKSSPEGGRPIRIADPPRSARHESDPSNGRVFEDSSGRLWLARGRSLCHASARAAPIEEGSWSCRTIESMRHAVAFVEPAPGVIWMATAGGGVLRGSGERWEVIAASLALPTSEVESLQAAASGGIWVAAHGTTLRVEDRPDLDE